MELRKQDLRAAHDDLVKMFQTVPQLPALDKDAGKYLNRELDAGVEEGRILLAALEDRKREIQRVVEASKFSPREHQLMVAAGRLPLTVPDSYSEPDAEEINLALFRELTAVGGRMLSGTAIEVGVPPFDLFMPIRLDAKKVEKKSCERLHDSPGYACSFRLYLNLSIPSQTYAVLRHGGGNDFFEDLMRRYISTVNKAEPGMKTHLFVLTGDGWRSPSMYKESVDTVLDQYTQILSDWPECNLVLQGNQMRCQ